MARMNDYADAIDKIVGARVRELRVSKGLSRAVFAGYLNISQEQLRKYEAATNRISAGRLKQISKLLDKSVSYFYGDEAESLDTTKNILDLRGARAFRAIKSEVAKRRILSVINVLNAETIWEICK